MSKIVVIGSANIDLMIATQSLPKPGETVRGRDFLVVPGGKGANQAVACARLGGAVSFVGCVGDDDFGRTMRAALTDSGAGVGHLKVAPNTATGVALILSEASGENCIAIAGGANDLLSPADIDAAERTIAAAALVVCQFESPVDTVARAIAVARRHHVPVLLNPAPAREIERGALAGVKFLVPNRHELAALTGRPVETSAEIEAAAASLLDQGVEAVIVTLGAEGALVKDVADARFMAAPAAVAVDTTGAGDTFVGAFAAEWCRTGDVGGAVVFAQRAAALSVTRRGAQAAMPRLSELR